VSDFQVVEIDPVIGITVIAEVHVQVAGLFYGYGVEGYLVVCHWRCRALLPAPVENVVVAVEKYEPYCL